MFRSIPWDVWIAATLAVAVVVVVFFDPGPAIFIALYVGLCAYIAVKTFGSERNTLKFLVTTALILLSGSALAQQPYAGLQNRTIKTLSEQQIADLNAGRGMGLALVAELNGYPGPIHTIELSERLQLSADQMTKLKSLFEAMKAETIPLGATLISQERSLNDDFANHTVTPQSLERNARSIGATQAALRAAHLRYHLSTVAILTSEQVTKYEELRGYRGDQNPAHHHQHQ